MQSFKPSTCIENPSGVFGTVEAFSGSHVFLRLTARLTQTTGGGSCSSVASIASVHSI